MKNHGIDPCLLGGKAEGVNHPPKTLRSDDIHKGEGQIEHLEGWMDGWMNGWLGGRTDGWTNGWVDMGSVR